MSINWPVADVDPVRRLRALAAGVPGAAVTERVVPAPFEVVWDRLSDFEGDFTTIQPDMAQVRVVSRSTEHVELRARGRLGLRAHLHGATRPGWCWLQSRFLIIGMAAAYEADGRTRVALTGGIRVPSRAAIVPVGVQRESRKSLDRLEELLDPRH
ncbi:MAG: hypothetical protein L0K86_12025 [Actinomycetia bacterium]|nr:hypothetical protein [Actinomycetes bacterium]